MKKAIAALMIGSVLSGCASWEGMTDTSRGSVIGALGGAAVGVATGHGGQGALIGAIGGGLAGAGIGHYMDSQAKDLNKVLMSEINQGYITVTKHANDTIIVKMTANSSFDLNSTLIKPSFFPTLNKIAQVANKYGKTTLTITGYTDSTGSHQINQPLSERRALAVSNYLRDKGVIAERLAAYGRGAANPVASNANEVGRVLNRRVEILIAPVVQ
jgi:outer membrane protein OmpA-like peptidoglycan-associated protein